MYCIGDYYSSPALEILLIVTVLILANIQVSSPRAAQTGTVHSLLALIYVPSLIVAILMLHLQYLEEQP